jgi:DNA polymerase-3 subunit beta
MAREATPVRLVQRTDVLELLAITQDVGQASEEVDAKYEGAELTVAFNAEYLIEGVEATTGAEISLQTQDAMRAALIRSTETSDYVYVLMPVRVS